MWFLGQGITLEYVFVRILVALLIIFVILPLHEYAHAFAAFKLGDPTAKHLGKMTLNPLASFSPIGAACLLLLDFGWANPTPVDASNFKNPRKDMAIVALAGPFATFLAALVGGLALNLFNAVGVECSALYTFFMCYISINVGLTVLNLLPIAPLDGYRILEAFIPKRFLSKYYTYRGRIGFLLFIILFVGVLDVPIAFFKQAIYTFIVKVTALPFLFV